MLTRSLVPRPDLRELREAWWCVPGCRKLGSPVVVGLA